MNKELQKWHDDSKKCYNILNKLSHKDLTFLEDKCGLDTSDSLKNKTLAIRRLLIHLQIMIPKDVDFT